MIPDLGRNESVYETECKCRLPVWSLLQVDRAPLIFYEDKQESLRDAMSIFRFRWCYEDSGIQPNFTTPIHYVIGYVIYGVYGFYILDFDKNVLEQIRKSVYKYTGQYFAKGQNTDKGWIAIERFFELGFNEEAPCTDEPVLGRHRGICENWGYAFIWNHQVPTTTNNAKHDYYRYNWLSDRDSDKMESDQKENYAKVYLDAKDYRKGATFANKKFINGFDLHNKKICGDLILDNVELSQLDISYCDIEGRLIVKNATIGDVSPKKDEVSFNATGLKAKSIMLENVITTNGISLINARIEGYLQLKNIRDYSNSNNERGEDVFSTKGYSLCADGIQCGGKIHFLGGFYKSNVFMRNAMIGGAVSLKSVKDKTDELKTLKIGDFSLRNSTITGGIRVRAVHIRERFDLSNVRANGHIRFTPARCLPPDREAYVRTDIGGDLRLSGIDMPHGRFEARALRVGGSINIISAKTGPIVLGLGRVMMSNQKDHRPDEIVCTAGRLAIISSEIDGWCRAPMIQITGTVDRNDRRGFIIEESQIRGSLDLWLSRAIRDNKRDMYAQEANAVKDGESPSLVECPPYPNAWQYSAAVNGILRVYNSQVSAMLDLTLVQVDGYIDLRSSTIDGDVAFSSYASYYYESDTHPEDKIYLKGKLNQIHGASAESACIHSLSLIGMYCKGDINLSGLRLYARHETDEAYTINATRTIAKGEIFLFSPPPEKNDLTEFKFYAKHIRNLNMTDAEASRFLLSEDSFRANTENPEIKATLYLRRVNFKIVQVYVSEYLRKKYGAPFALTIWGATIGNWFFFGKSKMPANWKRLKDFLEFQGEFPIRSFYSATEAFFRKNGYRNDADKILKEGEKKMIFIKWRNRTDALLEKWSRFKSFFS